MEVIDAIFYGFIGGGLLVVALLVVLLVVAKVTNQRADDDWSQFIDGMVSADMADTRTNGIEPDERDGDGSDETKTKTYHIFRLRPVEDGYYRGAVVVASDKTDARHVAADNLIDDGPDWTDEELTGIYEVRPNSDRGVILADFYES